MNLELELSDLCNRSKTKLHLVNNGIASRIGNDIFLNKQALKYPDYARKLIIHELKHSDSFNKSDIVHDLKDTYDKENFRFALKHPSAWLQLIPFGKWKGKMWWDVTLLIYYSIVIGILVWITIILK